MISSRIMSSLSLYLHISLYMICLATVQRVIRRNEGDAMRPLGSEHRETSLRAQTLTKKTISLEIFSLAWKLQSHLIQWMGNVSETPTPTTCLKSTAVHLQFVRQYAPHLYRRTFLASKLRRKGNPAVRLPFVLQYASHLYGSTPPHLYGSTFGKILGVGVTGTFLIEGLNLQKSYTRAVQEDQGDEILKSGSENGGGFLVANFQSFSPRKSGLKLVHWNLHHSKESFTAIF